jgi:hypothetical protein
VLGRTYVVQYTDGRGQAQTERGRLVALDQEGFVVLEVNGKHLVVPKACIDAKVYTANWRRHAHHSTPYRPTVPWWAHLRWGWISRTRRHPTWGDHDLR